MSQESDAGKPRDIRDSHHDAAGDMGVSSEREGHTGPGQHGTDGIKDTTTSGRPDDEDAPPEQSAGGEETNPEGLPPKAGYSSVDPRSKGKSNETDAPELRHPE